MKKNVRKMISCALALATALSVMFGSTTDSYADNLPPSNSYSYDVEANKFTFTYSVPRSIEIDSAVPADEYPECGNAPSESIYISWGHVVDDSAIIFNNKKWDQAGATFEAGDEYGLFFFLYLTDEYVTAINEEKAQQTKVSFNGKEITPFYNGSYYANQHYIYQLFFAISFGVLQDDGSLLGGDLGGEDPAPAPKPAPAPVFVPSMRTTNIRGYELSSWEEIIEKSGNLTSSEMIEDGNPELLQVGLENLSDRVIPSEAVKAVSEGMLNGLHLFIGDDDAVTFVKGKDYSGYETMDFSHKDSFGDNSRTIDFTLKKAIGGEVVFHSVIPEVTESGIAILYKEVDGIETELMKVPYTEEGRLCFLINETAKYIIRW